MSTRRVFSCIFVAIPNGDGVAEHEHTTLSTMTSVEPSHHDVEMALRRMEIQATEGEPFLGPLTESPCGRAGECDDLEVQLL